MNEGTSAPVPAGAVSLWASGNFRRYFVARSASLLGDTVLPIGLSAAVLEQGFGASGVGYALAASLAPTILLMLFGGALADHFRPKPMMVIADVVRFLAQGVLCVLLLVGEPSLWALLVTQLVFGVATALFQPTISGLVPEIAPVDVHKANGLLRIAESMVTLGGPALAGILLAFAPATAVVGIDAATCLISAVLVATLRLAGKRGDQGPPKVFDDIREGWSEFVSRPWLYSVISAFAVMGLAVFGPFQVLSATVLTEDHGASAYGLLMSAHGLGAVIGGLVGLRRMPRRPLRIGALAMLAFAPQLAFIALGAPVPLVAVGMLVAGIGRSYWAVMWSTSVQTRVPPDVLNRVLAYEITGSMMLIPVGRAVAGPVSESLGSTPVLMTGAVCTVIGCLSLLLVPSVRRLALQQPGRVPGEPAEPVPASSPRTETTEGRSA